MPSQGKQMSPAPNTFPRLPRSQDHCPHTHQNSLHVELRAQHGQEPGRQGPSTHFSSSALHSQCSGPQWLWTSHSTFPMTEVGHCCQLSPTQPVLLRLPIAGRRRTPQSPSAFVDRGIRGATDPLSTFVYRFFIPTSGRAELNSETRSVNCGHQLVVQQKRKPKSAGPLQSGTRPRLTHAKLKKRAGGTPRVSWACWGSMGGSPALASLRQMWLRHKTCPSTAAGREMKTDSACTKSFHPTQRTIFYRHQWNQTSNTGRYSLRQQVLTTFVVLFSLSSTESLPCA